MTKAILNLILALTLTAVIAPSAAASASVATGDSASQEVQAANQGNSNRLTIIFATLGASVGAAALASLGYLLRRRLGLDWHPSSGAASAGHHQEEAAAGVHHSEASEDEQQRGDGHP